MKHLSLAAPPLVIIAAVLLLFGAGWLCVANWQRSANRRASGRLELLRFVLVTLLAATLLRPEFVRKLERSSLPDIAVLVDASGSMSTRDIDSGHGVISREEWVRQQLAQRVLAPLEHDARISIEPFAAPSTNESAVNGTDLDEALEGALHHYKNLKAVVLMTDGD